MIALWGTLRRIRNDLGMNHSSVSTIEGMSSVEVDNPADTPSDTDTESSCSITSCIDEEKPPQYDERWLVELTSKVVDIPPWLRIDMDNEHIKERDRRMKFEEHRVWQKQLEGLLMNFHFLRNEMPWEQRRMNCCVSKRDDGTLVQEGGLCDDCRAFQAVVLNIVRTSATLTSSMASMRRDSISQTTSPVETEFRTTPSSQH